MDIGCPACRDAGEYLDADGAERGADIVAQRVYRARGGGAKRQRAARDCGGDPGGRCRRGCGLSGYMVPMKYKK